jgi:hypothetical protein
VREIRVLKCIKTENAKMLIHEHNPSIQLPPKMVVRVAPESVDDILRIQRATSTGVYTTTTDFAPGIMKGPFINPSILCGLELLKGVGLQNWLDKYLRN